MHKRYAKKDGHVHCETEQCHKFNLAERPSTNCAIFLHLIVTFISTRVKKLANFGNEIKENYYGYNLRESAFLDLMSQDESLQRIVGNFRVINVNTPKWPKFWAKNTFTVGHTSGYGLGL